MSYISYMVLVCMFSILFKPTSPGPVAGINNPEYVSKNDVTNESDYNKKLVKNMFSIFSTIPNGFDPNQDSQLKIEHKKPSVICWTHIVTKMKNYEGDIVDQISEYAISFESPTNPDYNYVINSDPDVYGNTRTFFITPPEIIYRNKDHIVEKNKYITCSFSSQYHKTSSKLPDGNVQIKIVRNNKKSESGRLLENDANEKTVTEQIPTEKRDATINVYPEYHQVVKKDKPSTLNCNNNKVDRLSNDNDIPDQTISRRMLDNNNESINEEYTTEYLHQPVTHCTENISEEATVENKHIPTTIEPTSESPQENENIERYPEVFPLKRIELVPSDDLAYKQHVYCQNINSHITAIRCPSDIISIPLINELRLPYYVDIRYSDITPDIIEANQLVVVGQRQCYLFEIVGETECPKYNWKILTIYEPIKDDIPYPENYSNLTEPEIQTNEDYSSGEQSTETTIDKNHSINTSVEISENPEIHTTAKPTTDISVDSFLIGMIKSNVPEIGHSTIETCLEIDTHVSVIQCPPKASLLPTINERILPNTVILNYLEDTPDIDDNKLIVRGEIFCYIFDKICETICPADASELFNVLEVDSVEPATTISATTQELFEHTQPETVTANNVPEINNNNKPEGFLLRIAEVKIDSSEEESTIKVICRYIDSHIYEMNCPSDIPDLPYFDEHLFPDHVELEHTDKLPEIDKPLILRGNKNCYILNMVNTTDCPSDTTNLLTLTILDNDEVESLESPESESQQILERKNSSPKPYDTNESEDESEEDCDYVSAEDEIIDKIQSPTTISYEPRYFQVRYINIVSFDKVAITCYNVDKYIALLNCPKNSEKIPEFDIEKLPSDTIILDEMGKEILLSENQMIVKGKGYCYALTKLNMEKCPTDGQRRMLNIIDCDIDSESQDSLNTEPINSLGNLINPSLPVAFEVMHISQRPNIPTYITVTCENMNTNIGIVKCPTGFFRIPIVNESLLSKYPRQTYTNMPELSENMVLARGKTVCYVLEKIGQIECPKDLNKIVKILTHDIIGNEELRSSMEDLQDIETVTKRLDETTTKIFSTTSKPIEDEPRMSTEYVHLTVPNKLHETTTEISSGTTKETVFVEDESSIFPVAIKVLHIPLQSDISSYLTVTCANVNSTVAIIDCPTEFEQIPILNDHLLSKYAKQIIHKNITEIRDNMLLVQGKKYCYILDQVDEIECPQYLNKIVKIFTSQVIQPEAIQTSTEYLQDIETATNKLSETTAKITSSTSRPTEEEPSTLTKYLEAIESTTHKLYESTAKIPSTSSRPLDEEPKASTKYLQDIESTTNKLYESTAKIPSSGKPMEDIETTTNKLHETTAKIASASSKPVEEKPGTTTKYPQDIETTISKLHETTTKTPSTSSKPKEKEPGTTTEYLQDIETATNKLHETTTKTPSTSSKPKQEEPGTTTEYLSEDNERVTNKLDKTTTEIISTTTAKNDNITFPIALENVHISPNLTIPTYLTITCENINGKITVINCPSKFQRIPTVNEHLFPENTKEEFHNSIPDINNNMLLVRGTKNCYIFDKIGEIECPVDLSKIIRILKYEEIESTEPREIETTTTEVPTTPSESSEEIILTDEETFPIAIQVAHISTQSNRPSYVIVHCENINRIINVIKCPKGFKKFPVINRKLLTKYITNIIPIKKPQLNDSMLTVRGNKGCYILHRIGEVKCPENMNNIIKILTYNSTEYLPNIEITTEAYNAESVSENSPTSDKINYEPIQVTETTAFHDSEQDGTSTESKVTTSNAKVTEASITIDNKTTSEATTVKANSENDEQNNEINIISTLHTTPVTEPTIELTTIAKGNTIASTATNILETHQEEITTDKSESHNNLANTVSSTTEQTTINSNLSSLESSTLPNTSIHDKNTQAVITDETIPTSSTNAAISTSASDNEVTEISQPNHELKNVKTTTENETTGPIITETTSPIVTEIASQIVTETSPIVTETTSPIVTEITSPIVTEITNPIVTETTSPIVTETTSSVVTNTTSPVVTNTTSPIVTERTSPIVTEITSPIVTEATSPIVTEATGPIVTEITSPIVTEATSPIVTERTSPIVTEATSPIVTESSPIVTETTGAIFTEITDQIVTETTSPIVTEQTSPIVTERTSPIVTEATSPIITETTSPIVTETTSPIVTEITSPIVTETSPIVTENSPIVTETTSPIVTESSPIVTETNPIVTETSPIVTENSPIITETTSPIVTERTSPIVTETTSPIVTERTSPIVTEATSPIITETTSPIVTETSPIVTESSPIVTETTSPIVTERTSPIVTEATSPIVTERTSPIVTEATSPIITETTSPFVTETSPIVTESSPIVTETTSPIVTERTSPIVTETTSPIVTERTRPIVTEQTSPIVTEINNPIVTERTSPIVTEITSPIVTETSPIVTESTSEIVTEITSQNINDTIPEHTSEKEIESKINTSKQPSETTIIDNVTETKPVKIISSTETSDLPDATAHISASTPDNIAENSHTISEKLTSPDTDTSQLTEDFTERYTTSHSTALWDETSRDFIDTTTTNYEVTTTAGTTPRNTDITESKITANEHTSAHTESTDTTLKADEKTINIIADTTTEKENAKNLITRPDFDVTTTNKTVNDVEKIVTEKSTEHIPVTERTVLVHQIVSSTNTPVQTEFTTESLFSNTRKEENTKFTPLTGDSSNNIIDLNETTTDSVHELHAKPEKVQNISTLSPSTIYEDVTTEKSNNKIVSSDEENIDDTEEDDDDYDDDEPEIDDDLAEYLLKNKLHGRRRSEILPLKKRGRKNKRFHKFKVNRTRYTYKSRTVPVEQQIRSNVHYNTESYTSTEKRMSHAKAYVKIHSPNNLNLSKTQQHNYTTVIYKSDPIESNSNANHNIHVAGRVNSNNNDDISTRPGKSAFPVKITNVFGPELTQMVCKYVDKNIKLINISTEIANLPLMNDGLLPSDVRIEYNEKLPHIMGNKNLLVRGMVYYYLLKEYNTIPCPENSHNFVPITMYYNGMKPTTPIYEITRNTDSDLKALDQFKTAVRKETDVQGINYDDDVMNTQMTRRRKLTKFNVKFTIVLPSHNVTTCGHIEEQMTVVDESGRTETMSIGAISSKERLYYDTHVPFQLPKDTLAVRSSGIRVWYVFRGYKEFKCPLDTTIFIPLTLHYNNDLRRAKQDLSQISNFPVKIINVHNPNTIQITCKLMESTITHINTTLQFENVPFMNISQLPENVIIYHSELSSNIIDDKNSLVYYKGMYYILKEYQTIGCPKNTDNFVPIILYQNDVSLSSANERNWKYALGEKEKTSSAFLQSTQHTNVESQTATPIHKIQTGDDPEIFKPKLNVDEELSVIPLVQEASTQPTKKEFVSIKQPETGHHPLPIVHALNPKKSKQLVISTTSQSYVTNEIPVSTEGPLLPSPAYLSSVVVKHNNIENKEDCYEVNNRMQVNKIPCPKDTSTIPHVINPEFMKLLCPKKLRPKLKYMTGLGILRKLNMIIHDPSKHKNGN